MDNFDIKNFITSKKLLTEQKDSIDPVDDETLEQPRDIEIDDDFQIDQDFEKGAFIMKLITKNFIYYLPIRVSQANKNGLKSLKNAISNVVYNSDPEFYQGEYFWNFPYWTEWYASKEVANDEDLDMSDYGIRVDWVEPIDKAPSKPAGVNNWKTYISDQYKKFTKEKPFGYDYYMGNES